MVREVKGGIVQFFCPLNLASPVFS